MTRLLLVLIVICSLLIACSSGRRSFDNGGLYPIMSQDRKWGYIDKAGNVVIQPQFERARIFSEGLASVSVDGNRYGYIDKSGTFVINPQYDEARSFSEGLAVVISDGKVGYIDTKGKVVITPQFERAYGDTG